MTSIGYMRPQTKGQRGGQGHRLVTTDSWIGQIQKVLLTECSQHLCKSNLSLITTLNPINIQLLQLLPSKWKSITQISEVLSLDLIYLKHARPAKSWSRRQALIIAFFCPLVHKKTKKKKKSLIWKNGPFSNWIATYCNVYKFEIHSSVDLYICITLF